MARRPVRLLFASGDDAEPADGSNPLPLGLRTQLLRECEAMVRHALASGTPLPAGLFDGLTLLDSARNGTVDDLPASAVPRLVVLHGQLAQLVAPAKPYTLHLMQTDPARNSWIAILGPLPNIRRLMTGSILFVLIFIGASVSPNLNSESIAANIYTLSGEAMVVNLVFIMAAAGIGAFFHLLFKAHKYVSEGTYEPKYESTYWMRVAMGVMSGLILAELIGTEFQQGNTMGKPVLALLGGFSATLLHRILHEMVSKVETLFRSGQPADSNGPTGDERSFSAPLTLLPPPPPPPPPPLDGEPSGLPASEKPANRAPQPSSDWLPR